ncbi:MAG TPA: DinB family protein [Gemmatimonadaceae bacterium]|nr:DinB family protein [Gemmatimonadaceae bacterium]
MTELALAESLPILERTPAVLRAQLQGLPSPWLSDNDGEGTWSPGQVVAHLVEAEHDLWIPRMKAILGGEAFPAFDREGSLRRWGTDSLDDLLDEFDRRRAGSLRDFRAIGPTEADLKRIGKHPEFGTVTLAQLLATWTAHDLIHLAQITRTMARRYREAVGPWRAYIRTLQ